MIGLDYIKEGARLKCENCSTVATAQHDFLPKGWFIVLDSTKQGLLFCRLDCVVHFINARMTTSPNRVVEKVKSF